jgi:anthranilate synthase component 2
VLDNYDSFTFNLVHLVGSLGAEVEVVRNDQTNVDSVSQAGFDAIVISPGPCTPNEAGITLDLIGRLGPTTPLFGVCLGMQAMAQAEGGKVVRAPAPVHGKTSLIHHDGDGVFAGIEEPFLATRYHSLVVERDSLPETLSITAETEDGLIMGLRHVSWPVEGVQFHPESIQTEHGSSLLGRFLERAARWTGASRDSPGA